MLGTETGTRLGRPYWALFASGAVSALGDGLLVVALPLLAAEHTRDPGLVAGVTVALMLPWLLVALPAGALVDRLARGRVMVAADVARFALLAGLGAGIAADRLSLPLLYAGALALGTANTIFTAASHAAVPSLVPRAALGRASGYLYAAQTAGEQLAGPALGGLLFAAAATVPFLADAGTFAASALLLLALRRRLPAPAREPGGSLRGDMAAGLRWFRGNEMLRTLSLVVGAMAACQAMVMGVLVLYGLEVLHLSEAGYGVFLGIGAFGNVVGALVADRLRQRWGAGTVVVTAGVAASAAYVLVAATSSAVVAGGLFVVECLAVAAGSAASIWLRQATVPDHLLGRVGNLFRMIVWGAIPLGTLAGGLVAKGFGLRAPLLVAAVLQVAVLAVAGGRLRRRVAEALVPVEIDLRAPAPAPVPVPATL